MDGRVALCAIIGMGVLVGLGGCGDEGAAEPFAELEDPATGDAVPGPGESPPGGGMPGNGDLPAGPGQPGAPGGGDPAGGGDDVPAGPGAGGMDAGVEPDAAMADAGGADPGGDCDVVIPPSDDCAAMLAPGDERECTIGSREYIVHAGVTMNPCEPVALVIDAHGATENVYEQLGTEEFCSSGDLCWAGIGSGWAAESDTPGGGFIAVFPQGISNRWSASDASFMLDIVEEMKKVANIDPDKVYMSGISNGAFLTYQTGCPNSDVFRGLSPNAGGSSCSSLARPIPVIAFGAEPDFAHAGNVAAADAMVELNNCTGGPKPWVTVDETYEEAVCRTAKLDTEAELVPCNQVTSAPIEPTVCTQWDCCDDGVKVVFCEVAPNDSHGPENASVDAHIIYENNTLLNTPSLAWRFFKEFW